MKFFYNNFVVIISSFVIIGFIKGLNGFKNHENICNTLKSIPVILFYGNKNVCLGFMWWVLYALLLLKIIISMNMFV